MDILTLSGFFGSGKTTLLLALARHWSESEGRRIAVIQNEIGRTGVDGQRLASEGLTVRELASGCICCTLQGSLSGAIEELDQRYQPQTVIVEASGAAAPRQLWEIVAGLPRRFEKNRFLVLFDAARLRRILASFSMPFVEDGLLAADAVLLNKIDLVQPSEVAGFVQRTRMVRAELPIFPVSALHGDGLAEVIDFLEGRHPTSSVAASFLPKTGAAGPAENTVRAVASRDGQFSPAAPITLQALTDAMNRIAEALRESGCPLIGHLKLFARASEAGFYSISVTDFQQPPRCAGSATAVLPIERLTLNAIAYGIAPERLEAIVEAALRSLPEPLPTVTATPTVQP